MSHATPTVFVVDDDVSVRESLKLLIESAGWHPETFGSGQEFLARPRMLAPSCLVLTLLFQISLDSICRRWSPIGPTCPSSS